MFAGAFESRKRAQRNGGGPPRLGGGYPLIGHTVDFATNLKGLLERARNEHGDVVRIKVLGRDIVLVTGPKGQEQVFRATDDVLSPKAAYKLMVPIFGKGVVYDCEDDRMNEQLRMLLPALQNKRMRTYAEIVTQEVQRSVESWGVGGVVDIYEYMQRLTNFTSSHCLLGFEFRNEMSDEFARVYHALERSIVPVAYLNANLPIPTFRKRDRARARLGEMVSEIVQRRRQGGYRREDFLQTLMEATYGDGSSPTDHEIAGMLIAAMFAGHHTSSVTASWAILEMLRHPKWLRDVREELETVFGDGHEVDFESLRKLEKTEWVIKEVLRLHPPLVVMMREAMQDTTILGHDIPKGTWLVLSPVVAHRIEEVFKDADSFCPHRFGPPSPDDQQPFAFIAFGGGRHKCLGNAFAVLQIKAILVHLLRHYEFELYGDPVESDFHGLVIGPKLPIRLRYRRIDDTQARPQAQSKDAGGDAMKPTRVSNGLRPFRIEHNLDLCQGHGACEGDAPEVFKLDGGKVSVLQEHPDPALRAKVERACHYCPQGAIKIVEAAENDREADRG